MTCFDDNNSRTTRRCLRALWILVCVGLGASCAPKPRPGTPPKHLLLITVEHLRSDHVSHLGYERRTTALLRPDQPIVLDVDRLAWTGVAFSNVYAPSSDPQTSLASLLSGKPVPPGSPRDLTAFFASDDGGLPQAFRKGGMVTSGFISSGSIETANQTAESFGKGFDHANFYSTDEETLAAAVEWLGKRFPEGREHLTWIHLAGIRAPFSGKVFTDLHSGQLEPVGSPAEFVTGLQAAGERPSVGDRQRLDDLYDGRVVRITELLNSFFFLYTNNFGVDDLWADSLVAVVGVTGCELGEHDGRIMGENSLREEALRVPLLFSHVGSATGERIYGEPVELTDVGATFRDWFGVEQRSTDVARSLLSITDSYVQREFFEHPALSYEAFGNGVSLRDDRFRLVVRGELVELYDLRGSDSAHEDVSEFYPEDLQRLTTALSQRLNQLGFETP